MKTPSCSCKARQSSPPPQMLWRMGRAIAWLFPTTVLVLLPKCPACLAAYIALGTGLGISLTAASHLYITATVLSVISLLWLATRQCQRWRAASATSRQSARSH